MRKFLDAGHARQFYVLRDDGGATAARYRFASLVDIPEQPIFSSRQKLVAFLKEQNLGQLIDIRTGAQRTAAVELVPLFGCSKVSPTPEYLEALRLLSETMYGYGPDGAIPSGYTYIAQFVAHELCRSEYLDWPEDATTTATFALDLESIYDQAPANGLRLELGSTHPKQARFDIHRDADGAPRIGNDRNDANLAISQIHCALVRFHNAIADAGYFTSFDDIKAQVTLVFQDMLLQDFLPRMTSRMLIDDIVHREMRSIASSATACPAEAALAAFRVGHSMIRPSYAHWNGTQAEGSTPTVLVTLTHKGGALASGHLPSDWPIDWRSMFDSGQSAGILHLAKRIDTTLVMDLHHIPPHLVQIRPDQLSVAFRTLWFGAAAQLMDGWTIFDDVRDAVGGGELRMAPDDLVPCSQQPGDAGAVFAAFPDLAEKPPLWWFILREAELFGVGGGLAGLGARLFAETVIAAIGQSPHSVLDGGQIHPALPGGTVPARMLDILQWGNQPLDWYREQ